MREGQGERGTGCERDRVREGQGEGGTGRKKGLRKGWDSEKMYLK